MKIRSGCKVENTTQNLRVVFSDLLNQKISFEQAENKVKELYNLSEQKDKFESQLQQAGLGDFNFQYKEEEPSVDMNIHETLSANNENLFLFHDAAKNKMQAQFSHLVFKHLFVDRKASKNAFITTPFDFNMGIVNFKNNLVQAIASALNISTDQIFNKKGGNAELYIKFLNNGNISNFLSKNLDSVLSKPLQDDLKTTSPEFDTFANIYILENFDSLLKQELNNLINIKPEKFGKLDNTSYTKEDDTNITTFWANDTYEDKGIKNYTSNLTKFILKQIPKVIKINGIYRHIAGEYLDANELYVLSGMLKQAEREYQLKYPNSGISFNDNTTVALRTLLNSDMPSITGGKRVLVDSLKAFLYDGEGDNAPIVKLYSNPDTSIKALDIESLLASEINQSYAPSYLEYDENMQPIIKNYNGAYDRSSNLANNLIDFIITELQKTKKSSKFDHYFIVNGLMLDPELYSSFLTEQKGAINSIGKKIQNYLKTPEVKKLVEEFKKTNDIGELYSNVSHHVKSVILKDKDLTDFKNKYNQFVSDRVITQFDTYKQTTLPVYRLESAITRDVSFISEYRKFESSQFQNFFSQNPHVFSKYNSPNNFSEFNSKYKDSTLYKVSVGENDDITEIYKLNASDQRLLEFLQNLLPLLNSEDYQGTFSFQPACYSDKISVGNKVANLEAKVVDVTSIGKKTNIALNNIIDLVNPKESLDKILNFDWFYRRNTYFNKVNNILNHWSKVFDDINPVEFNFEKFTSKSAKNRSYYDDFMAEITKLQKHFSEMTGDQLFDIIAEYGNEIEFNDELDYVLTKKGKVQFNQALLLELERVSSLANYKKYAKEKFNEFLNSEEYKNILEVIKKFIQTSTDSPVSQLFTTSIVFSEAPFKRKYNKETKNYDITQNPNSNFEQTIETLLAAENFLTFNYLEIVSKNHLLDPAKNLSSPQAEESSRIDAMAKRMVEYPATIQQFQQNNPIGISNEINIAVVTDPKEEVWNPSGDSGKLKIYDGLGELSPFEARMEYNSLPGHGIKGIIKSLGVGNYGDRNTLLKWAGHPQTNEKMRMSKGSKFKQQATFRKMHSIPFGEVDITKSWTDKVNLNQVQSIMGKDLYFQDGFRYYKFIELSSRGNNLYNLELQEVDINGKKIGNPINVQKQLNTIYDIWMAYGGTSSMELSNGELIYSENSLDVTFNHIIYAGNRLREGNSQSDIYQPLRNKFINVLCNQGAMKRGAANINKSEKVYDPFNNDPLTTFKFVTNNYGIQLDANHEADMEDIREMSQTISTIATLGYTSDLAQNVYDQIGQLVQNAINNFKDQLSDFEYGNISNAIEKISKQLIKRMASDNINTVDSFVEAFTTDLDKIVLPISDRKFYKPFISEIIDKLNKSGIIRRYTGFAGVLSGGNNLVQMYELNGKIYSYPALLKEALRFFNDSANKQFRDNLEQNWFREDAKDQDIVDYYLAFQSGSIDPEDLASDVVDYMNSVEDYGSKIIKTTEDLKDIKILDTIFYQLPGDNQQTKLTLDSPNNLIKYQKLIQSNFGNPRFVLMKSLKTPRDLRPQYISWIKEGSNIMENVYTTKAAMLQNSLNQTVYSDDIIKAVLADLAEEGQQIKQMCKI